jgi:hypothetical protein
MRFFLMFLLFISSESFSQGFNHTWLLGYHTSTSNNDTLMRMDFDSSNSTLVSAFRKMPFGETQGNISDANGNFLMSSNGIWIANSINDTMLNGTNLNPGFAATSAKPFGLSVLNGNIILPMPNDTNKFVLFHQTFGDFTNYAINIFYTVIDKTLDGGKGGVVSKNNIALSGAFGYGMAACKHGNGRDWWIVALNNTANIIHKFLLTPNNVQYVGSQNLNVPAYGDWTGQPVFSPDGNKFAYRHGYGTSSNWNQNMRLFHFDRCDATFTLDSIIDYSDSLVGFGTAFSANSRFLYFSSYSHLFQLDTDSLTNIGSLQLVKTNDTFASPSPPFYTNFYAMYLAADSKIYIVSTNSVVDLHSINFPDSSGISCNVQLHNLHLPKFNARTVPVHPNYYLGRLIGSPCDSLTSINDLAEHDFRFSISPNPSNGNFKIIYLLPQNKKGMLEIFDVTGKRVYAQNLPHWSTLQKISLPNLTSGVYSCSIISGSGRINKKLIVLNE